ncbi:MAG TPA: sterol desaturase family protein [Caulobacteraceae bacterium]|jgi:sterol desaturase/sphingolipid hydroxylase (fatty acid hydroxylase superfamily)
MMPLFGWALVAVGIVAAEAAISAWLKRPLYGLRETEVGLALTFGWGVGGIVTAGLSAGAIAFCYGLRIFNPTHSVGWFIAAFVCGDFVYYFWHVMSHKLRWMWATHAAHHTAHRLNVLSSVRQGWTDAAGTWLTWAPLGFLGFTPTDMDFYFTVLLVWEAFTHNEWMPALGPLEYIFITPSNHRVHHSLAPEHWDRNYGGVLCIWDRLFGTYAAEGATPITEFGLVGLDRDAGPIETVLYGWKEWFAHLSKGWAGSGVSGSLQGHGAETLKG